MLNKQVVHVILSDGPRILFLKLIKKFLLNLVLGIYSEIYLTDFILGRIYWWIYSLL
jgi:hypothetical protein